MAVLDGCAPERVFYYFEEISHIPHGSGNVEQISQYLKDFAAAKGLACIQDAFRNIIIIKDAAPGYEQEAPVILQGHMDMVAVKDASAKIDMKQDPLKLLKDGDKLMAEGTSLGGDDGIAVAYCLALLEAEELPHPRLEVILTTDEETGMEGAREINLSMLQGRQMINLDSEEEGEFLVSCAGGARADISLPVRRTALSETDMVQPVAYRVTLQGLRGGHSGTEIVLNGGNANILLGKVLSDILDQGQCRVFLEQCRGGNADNAIPGEAEALVWLEKEQEEILCRIIKEEEQILRDQFGEKEPALCIVAEALKDTPQGREVVEERTLKTLLELLHKLPNGVQSMSKEIEGLVETSLNLGIMELQQDRFTVSYAVRSSVEEEKEALCRQMETIADTYGAAMRIHGAYPGWAYRPKSPLRDKMIRVYQEMYGREPLIKAIHAGLECGLLQHKIKDLDCVSIGPDMENVHTTQETLSILSVQRVWEFLLAFLAQK